MMKPSHRDDINTQLIINVNSNGLPFFLRVLSSGFMIKTAIGGSLKQFLMNEIGLSQEYLEARVQTIFLNGKAIDNSEAAMIEDCSTVALSAAMPGLVGATFRKGGHYASLRNRISHNAGTHTSNRENGLVMIKLFNLIALDIGPELLNRGILVKRKTMTDLFKFSQLQDRCLSITLDQKQLEPHQFDIKALHGETIWFQVRS